MMPLLEYTLCAPQRQHLLNMLSAKVDCLFVRIMYALVTFVASIDVSQV